MSEYSFEFAVLRYVHDPITQEFVNIGVVVYSREAFYLKPAINARYGRLSQTFQIINGDHYRSVTGHLERQITQCHNSFQDRKQQFDALQGLPDHLKNILDQILPPDDSSLVFDAYGVGFVADLDAELERLYDRLVLRYEGKAEQESRSDNQVWQIYRAHLESHRVISELGSVTIHTPGYRYSFDHAWKNERWHPIEPVSLDMVYGTSILDKAAKWIGRAASLSESQELGTLYLLLGAPHRDEVMDDYTNAVRTMKNKIPFYMPVEIIEEDSAENWSAEFAQLIKNHQQER